jgi:hypothetical protein
MQSLNTLQTQIQERHQSDMVELEQGRLAAHSTPGARRRAASRAQSRPSMQQQHYQPPMQQQPYQQRDYSQPINQGLSATSLD